MDDTTDPEPFDLTALRRRAEQLMRDEDDVALFQLESALRSDAEWWPHLWSPGVALAARRLGRPNAIDILQEAIAHGFGQPELFEGELEMQFGDEPAWPELETQMHSNVPRPPIELTQWPDAGANQAIELYCIRAADRAALRDRIPSLSGTAWEVAKTLLAWVHKSWSHANDHVSSENAVHILERVAAGDRFACVEYSIVLSQALNAVGIPARRVDLRRRNHHIGVGRGHVVSEAWLDDLDQWVLLDGQNGSYWAGRDGAPLGVLDLQRSFSRGERPQFVPAPGVARIAEDWAATWFEYFDSASTTGFTWSEPCFSPVFQKTELIQAPRILHDGRLAYPRLSSLTTSLAGTTAEPVVRFTSHHPYASGIRLRGRSGVVDLSGDWPLDLAPGSHDVTVSAITPWGESSPSSFNYRVQ